MATPCLGAASNMDPGGSGAVHGLCGYHELGQYRIHDWHWDLCQMGFAPAPAWVQI